MLIFLAFYSSVDKKNCSLFCLPLNHTQSSLGITTRTAQIHCAADVFLCLYQLKNMLFNDILKEKYDQLAPVFNKLFDLAIKNQTHSGDLLLVMENAHLTEESDPDDNEKVKLFYNIGPTMDYHCETANHNFIKQYIRSVITMPYEDYKALHVYSPEKSKEIDDILFEESNTIQVEMLIYLKIWEGEAFLKKMYQVSRLVTGQDYDWHLRITHKKKKAREMERHELLTKLKENLQQGVPELFDVVNRVHRSQLRNAIAHSQYAMLGRNIMLNNQNKRNSEHQHGFDFNEWVDLFHDTLTIYTLYEVMFDKVKEYYFETAKEFNLKKEVRVTRLYPEERRSLILLYSREYFKDWSPHPNRQ
jgi:hypothetical protein